MIADDKARSHLSTFENIRICWPRDSKMPTISGKWERLADGRILATYTRDELAQCFEVFEAISGDELADE